MQKSWQKESVVYQIYPRSFRDSNGDGVGDLRGIIEKLDYLQELGVDVIWLSPVYRTPNDDNGYDISDYRDIEPEFGTLADWEELLAGMHARGIKLVMDLVVNHTSDEHAWFVESRQSRDNACRDYYIWRPGKDGKEPNNWESFFSGSAWQFDAATGEYYLHLFSRKQPDLNWENPQVRGEVYDLMKWWLDKGSDGFRMDVINLISKTPGLPDAPALPGRRYAWGGEYFVNGPQLLEFLQEMKQEVLAHYDIFTVGETPATSPEQAVAFTDGESGALNMIFQFEHMDVDVDSPRQLGKWAYKPLDLRDLKQTFTRWQKGLEDRGWNSLYLTNHDQPRAVSRFGHSGEYRVPAAKLLATFLHTLQGTPYIYQGEEIGMTNVEFPAIEDYRDIETLNMYKDYVGERGLDPAEVLGMIYKKGRDNARTPMQWDASANAGFSSGTPWIGVNPNYKEINVEADQSAADSIFRYYQQLIRLRKQHPILVYGTYDLLLPDHPEIYAYTRTLKGERLLVILNFSANTPVFNIPEGLAVGRSRLLIGNYAAAGTDAIDGMTLHPFEARVYQLS